MRRTGTATNHAKFLTAAGVLLLMTVAIACSPVTGDSSDDFYGTTLTANAAAPPFTLRDQFGNLTSLSDFQGKVVLLTFLYTNCPDVCPITTNQLREAYDSLGETTNDIAIVAVSLDPARDTVAAAMDYSERWKMTDRWSYLVGTERELAPTWKAYYLDPTSLRPSAESDTAAAHDLTPRPNAPKAGIDALVQESYLVIHSAPIYLIDQEGKMRVIITHPFDVAGLVRDVQALSNQG
ncbi:MAG: SCO family protein [Chloroflexi bacterium]|nr:SCO family protein [Chloroflexota bacterium]